MPAYLIFILKQMSEELIMCAQVEVFVISSLYDETMSQAVKDKRKHSTLHLL